MPSSGGTTADNEATVRNGYLLLWRRLASLNGGGDFHLTHPALLGSPEERYYSKALKVTFKIVLSQRFQ